MTCQACHYTNDDEAQFCEQCGHVLEISCPACGNRAKASARFCRRCGQPLAPSRTASQPAAALTDPPAHTSSLDDRLDQLQRYLPAHLAAKILANRGRLTGERKLVTVLFADLVGYSTLSVQLGEEALFALMDNLYELLIHEIHRYEGTVNELTGDGLVAFFGAPLAVEQAPQRAVRAALAMQEAVARFSASLKHSADLHVRVGINTGPVIVGTVGNNLRMDYKAVGHTVNLAARMEQTAMPGTVQLTEHAYKLVAGYFDCDDVGPVSLKGLPTRVRAYRVTGERGMRTRLEVARERGLTRLVGRQRELDMLRQCFALVQRGRGQAVSIIGEAGLGKSRLLYEFRQTLGDVDYTWLEGRCSPYGAALAYGPIIEVLKQYCGIDASDRDEDMRQKVAHGLAQLGPAQEATVPYLAHLLAAGMDGSRLASMAPEALKHQIFEALRGLVGAIAARRSLVLTIEDLHWVDPTTTEVLTFLLEHLAGVPILLLCTYRPDFASLWSRKSYHSVLTLKPLDSHEGFEMLTALLGTPHMQDELAALVLNKTEGVPFFLEELVTALRETGAMTLHEDQWRLTASATAVPVPGTVEEVLMSRLDRLPEGAKSVLQTGAVIGREVSGALLQEVVGLPEHELTTHLAALTEAELLYTRGLQPQTTYVFKHAFTQEATYRSVLTARRRELHHRVAVTIEALFPDRLEEYYGQLAYHYLEGAQGDAVAKAIAYAVRAGERYMALPAYAEAARFYHLALEVLAQHAPADEAQRYALLLALGVAQRKASEHVDALETLQRAAESARRLGSAEALAQAAIEFERVTWVSLLATEPAVHLLQEALQELGEEHRTLRAQALGSLARALLFTGAEEQATRYAQQAVEVAREVGDPGALAFALLTLILMPWEPAEARERLLSATEMVQLAEAAGDSELILEAHTQRMLCLLDLGDIAEVDVELQIRTRLSEELQQSSYLAVTTGVRAMRALLDGRFTEAERLALQARDIEQRVQAERHAWGFWGADVYPAPRAGPSPRGRASTQALCAATWDSLRLEAWPGAALQRAGTRAGSAPGVRAPGAARLRRPAARRPLGGLYDLSRRGLRLPRRCRPRRCPVSTPAALYWPYCRGGWGRCVLRCCVTLSGHARHDHGTLGGRSTAL